MYLIKFFSKYEKNKNKRVAKKYKFIVMETIKEENRLLLYISEKYYFITNNKVTLIKKRALTTNTHTHKGYQ